ncbi:MAG TPA: ABC transporter ATP-binding protein [Phycisphaerae bacterium]|nr:ABC transporter ATP-binding protein [Phycisphaerae bacterium]
MPDNENILVGSGLQKSFGKGDARVHVLRGLDLSVRRGEFLAVMGPSGCGKSTLLHVLGLITPPDQGQVAIDGRIVGATDAERTALRRTHIGFVFQRFNLLGVLSAADNVAISLKVRGMGDNGRAEKLFERMGVAHVMRRKPSDMSIGEQQRVAVVRALAHEPAIVLADEPTGNLDSGNAKALLELLRELNRQEHRTIVLTTHSAQAAAYADRIVHMQDGKIIDRDN